MITRYSGIAQYWNAENVVKLSKKFLPHVYHSILVTSPTEDKWNSSKGDRIVPFSKVSPYRTIHDYVEMWIENENLYYGPPNITEDIAAPGVYKYFTNVLNATVETTLSGIARFKIVGTVLDIMYSYNGRTQAITFGGDDTTIWTPSFIKGRAHHYVRTYLPPPDDTYIWKGVSTGISEFDPTTAELEAITVKGTLYRWNGSYWQIYSYNTTYSMSIDTDDVFDAVSISIGGRKVRWDKDGSYFLDFTRPAGNPKDGSLYRIVPRLPDANLGTITFKRYPKEVITQTPQVVSQSCIPVFFRVSKENEPESYQHVIKTEWARQVQIAEAGETAYAVSKITKNYPIYNDTYTWNGSAYVLTDTDHTTTPMSTITVPTRYDDVVEIASVINPDSYTPRSEDV